MSRRDTPYHYTGTMSPTGKSRRKVLLAASLVILAAIVVLVAWLLLWRFSLWELDGHARAIRQAETAEQEALAIDGFVRVIERRRLPMEMVLYRADTREPFSLYQQGVKGLPPYRLRVVVYVWRTWRIPRKFDQAWTFSFVAKDSDSITVLWLATRGKFFAPGGRRASTRQSRTVDPGPSGPRDL